MATISSAQFQWSYWLGFFVLPGKFGCSYYCYACQDLYYLHLCYLTPHMEMFCSCLVFKFVWKCALKWLFVLEGWGVESTVFPFYSFTYGVFSICQILYLISPHQVASWDSCWNQVHVPVFASGSPAACEEEIKQIVTAADALLAAGKDTVIVTSRDLVTGKGKLFVYQCIVISFCQFLYSCSSSQQITWKI